MTLPSLLENRFVTLAVTSQARGLSINVNLNPAAENKKPGTYFPSGPKKDPFPVEEMARELRQVLQVVLQGRLRLYPNYQSLPTELLQLRHVALLCDAEPVLVPNFAEAVQGVVWLRALGNYFKVVLIARGTCLHYPGILQGIDLLTKTDELWIMLDGCPRSDAGITDQLNTPADRIISNILLVGRKRPVVIQSLFSMVKNQEQPSSEIHKYLMRLNEIKDGGAQISRVQICSARTQSDRRTHLSLRTLSQIAQTIRQTTGMRVEIY